MYHQNTAYRYLNKCWFHIYQNTEGSVNSWSIRIVSQRLTSFFSIIWAKLSFSSSWNKLKEGSQKFVYTFRGARKNLYDHLCALKIKIKIWSMDLLLVGAPSRRLSPGCQWPSCQPSSSPWPVCKQYSIPLMSLSHS